MGIKEILEIARQRQALVAKSSDEMERITNQAVNLARTRAKIIEDAQKHIDIISGTGSLSTRAWLEEIQRTANNARLVSTNKLLSDMALLAGMRDEDLEVIEVAANEISPPLPAPDDSSPEIQALKDSVQQLNKQVAELQQEIGKLRVIRSEIRNKEANHKRGANRVTRDKIRRLAEYRQQAIDERGNVPGWIHTCQDVVHIDSRIAAKYAPELSEKWEDRSFKWKGFDDDD